MPNLGTGLVGKWLTTMDGNLRGRQQGGSREGLWGSTMLGGLPRPQPRMLTDTAARQHGRGGTAAARLIIRGRLGLDEGRGEGERGLRAWPWVALMVMMMMTLSELCGLPR